MENNTYFKTPTERALEIFKGVFGDYFKGYFNGLMDDIPQNLLPCVMASSVDVDVEATNTAQDRLDENVAIVVAINKKDHIGPQGETNLADLHLRALVMGQDPETSQYLPRTIIAALRGQFTMEYTVVDNRMRIEFGPNERGEKLFTQEAFITLTVRRNVLVARQ